MPARRTSRSGSGRKVGTLGKTGCFSFQASKNLNSGEGGAILTNDEALVEACYRFHNNSRGRRNTGGDFSYRRTGANLRLTEFQAALLLAQMTRLEDQSRTRERNAAHLTKLLKQIPGITPARMYDGCTRNAYHLYMFRYDPTRIRRPAPRGVPQGARAEGVPASRRLLAAQQGAVPGGRVRRPAATRRSTAKARLDAWRERNRCPENDRLCAEAVWLTQTMLLGPAAGHGPHRRGRAQDPGTRVEIDEPLGSDRLRMSRRTFSTSR